MGIKKDEIFPFSEGGIVAMAAIVLEKYKQTPQKDEVSDPEWGKTDIVAAAAIRKHKKQD